MKIENRIAKKNGDKLVRGTICLLGLVFLTTATLQAANELNGGEPPSDEEARLKAIEETLNSQAGGATSREILERQSHERVGERSDFTDRRRGNTDIQEHENIPLAAKGDSKTRKKETLFFVADDIRWEVDDQKANFEIRAEEEVLLRGTVVSEQDGSVLKWRPDELLVIKEKKINDVASPRLQRVRFSEKVEKTKELGVEPPYYVLDEVLFQFVNGVYYEMQQREGLTTISFFPRTGEDKKEQSDFSDEELSLKELSEAFSGAAVSASELLGSLYQAKEKYEAFVLNRGLIDEVPFSFRGRKKKMTFFDVSKGLPDDITPVFKQEYPDFGTPEFWKKHLRGALKQTFGFSSNFDGNFGSSGPTSNRDKAFLWWPNVAVNFRRFGYSNKQGQKPQALRTDINYQAHRFHRLFPLGSHRKFGDGYRSQSINLNLDYYSQKRYVLSTRNTINLFGEKQHSSHLNDESKLEWIRTSTKGYRMTNSVGFSYLLTPMTSWSSGVGLERTWSDSDTGRSRDKSLFISSGLNTRLTKRTEVFLNYGYRHILKDSGPGETKPDLGEFSVFRTKGKDLYTLTGGSRRLFFKRLFVEGSSSFGMIDGKVPKFGGSISALYRMGKRDCVKGSYNKGMVQDNTGKMIGGRHSGPQISLNRIESVGIEYWHEQGDGQSQIGAIFDYSKTTPLSGVYGSRTSMEDWIIFELAWRRMVAGGRMRLELKYRYSQNRSKSLSYDDNINDSIHEHAFTVALTNYFGEWGG